MSNGTARDRSDAMTCKFFFFSEMGYNNAYPLEAVEQYGYSALLFPNSLFDAAKARDPARLRPNENITPRRALHSTG
jgi:hypothetical protein